MTALRHRVGQLLIAGVEGVGLTTFERSWLRLVRPGGIILFGRNIGDAAQTYGLLAETETLTGTPLFRCVDLEGGLVDRLREAIGPMPSPAAVASSGKAATYRKHGLLVGSEARLCGFNVVLAPVLDLALPESQRVMRTRTYFSDGEEVTGYAREFLSGLAAARVLGCGKHFPGLGGGDLDSHQSTPVIRRSPEMLWEQDLLPYRLLKSSLPMVMVSHASYPETGYDAPASVSGEWITDVLVGRIRYRGLIVSDDMEMGGILARNSIEDAVVGAVLAGTHLVEICKDPSLLLRAYEALLSEAERSPAFRLMVERAFRKVKGSKRAIASLAEGKPPSRLQIQALQRKVSLFREQHPEPALRSES